MHDSQFAKKKNVAVGDSNQCVSSMLLRVLAIAAGDPPREIRVVVKHHGPKPLRRRLTGLCEERLALANRDCYAKKSEHLQMLKEDSMKFRPLHDRVVVKRIDAEEKTAGGIIIPDS